MKVNPARIIRPAERKKQFCALEESLHRNAPGEVPLAPFSLHFSVWVIMLRI